VKGRGGKGKGREGENGRRERALRVGSGRKERGREGPSKTSHTPNFGFLEKCLIYTVSQKRNSTYFCP